MKISHSSGKKYDRCPWLWYAHYILKETKEQPPSGNLLRGIEYHEQLEKLAKRKLTPDDPQIFPIVRKIWKIFESEVVVGELAFDVPLPHITHTQLIGKIDLIVPKHSLLLDYKFSGNPKAWLPDREAMAKNDQITLYAYAYKVLYKKWPKYIGQVQVNLSTENIETIIVPLDKGAVYHSIEWIENTAKKIKFLVEQGIGTVPSVASVPGHHPNCNEYGRSCPAYDWCWAKKYQSSDGWTTPQTRQRDALASLVGILDS